MESYVNGRVSALQTLGTLDGPGIRYVVFLQGCPLRCACCHNPETWAIDGGTVYNAKELFEKVLRYKEYFGEKGGITLSGGEPLLQPEFAAALFALCKENGINTCLDTSGCIINDSVVKLLEYTDLVMLDIKYTDNETYLKYVGCEMQKPLSFLDLLEEKGIPTYIRQVIIPTLNDNKDNILRLSNITRKHKCVIKTEILPFKKLCQTKYKELNIPFALENTPEPTINDIKKLEEFLKK